MKRTVCVLAAMIGLVAGSALGNWIAWSAAGPLPSTELATSLVRQAIADPPVGAVTREDAPFVDDGPVLGSRRFAAGAVCFSYAMTPPQATGSVAAADLGLRAGGWQVRSSGDPAHRLVAELDGQRIEIASLGPCPGQREGTVTVRVLRAEPASALAAAVSGGLIGGLCGWFLGVWLSRRRTPNVLVWLGLLAFVPEIVWWAVGVLTRVDGEVDQVPMWAPFAIYGLRPLAILGVVLVGAAAVLSRPAPRAEINAMTAIPVDEQPQR